MSTKARTKATIAVVEDDDDVRHSTRLLLESDGYSVQTFDSAEAYLASSLDHDFLVLDLRLPRLSGQDVLKRLLERDKSLLPVIIVSAESQQLKERINRPGLTIILDKPLAGDDLLAAIDKLSGRH